MNYPTAHLLSISAWRGLAKGHCSCGLDLYGPDHGILLAKHREHVAHAIAAAKQRHPATRGRTP